MRVLVTGSRDWHNPWVIRRELEALGSGNVLIHGDANGADRIAGSIALDLGWEVVKYPANWRRYGRAAGPVRNQQMLDEGQPETVIAFHEDLNTSKGTKDMVTRAIKAGLPVKLVAR